MYNFGLCIWKCSPHPISKFLQLEKKQYRGFLLGLMLSVGKFGFMNEIFISNFIWPSVWVMRFWLERLVFNASEWNKVYLSAVTSMAVS